MAQEEFSRVTRRHFFLCRKKKSLLVAQEEMWSCSTTRLNIDILFKAPGKCSSSLVESDAGADTKANNEANAAGDARAESASALVMAQPSLMLDPRMFDWKAAVEANRKSQREKRSRVEQEIARLAAALDAAERGARLDYDTPEDGHCLLHGLAAGGLLSDIPDGLTVNELREIALQGATMQQLQAAAVGTGEEGLTIERYVEGMRRGLYGDNLIISLLARGFQRGITVIRPDYIRTFLADGGEQEGVLEGAIWIAHYGEDHYFGVLRAGAGPSASTRGQELVVRERLDTACGGVGKRRLLRNSHFWHGSRAGKKRQTGGRLDDDEPDGLAADEHGPDMPDYKDVPYCQARQRSPDCVRGGKRYILFNSVGYNC